MRTVAKGRTYDEIEGGGWIADDEVSRVDITKKMPGWANEGEKWIAINVTPQVLVFVVIVSRSCSSAAFPDRGTVEDDRH